MEAAPDAARVSFRATLREPNFSRLLAGQVIAAFGDRINQTALLSIIVYQLGNTSKYSADIIFWGAVPRVALGVFAAALIDRFERKKILIASDLSRAFLALLLPLLWFGIHHHYVIYAVTFFMGMFSALFAPARLAIMPNLVPSKTLLPANAISSQAGTVASLAAMPIAGWIVENLGISSSFVINSLTYMASATLIWKLRPRPLSEEVALRAGVHPLEDFKAGLVYIFKDPFVLFFVVFSAMIQMVGGVFFVCFLTYAIEILGQTVGGANLLFGTVGLGMGLGAVWLIYFSKWGEWFLWPTLLAAVSGLGPICLSMIYTPWLAAAFLLLTGFAGVMASVPVDTFLQKHVSDAFRGRVFVAQGVLAGSGFLVSLQFSKAFIYHFGALDALKWLGIVMTLFGVLATLFAYGLHRWISSRRSLSIPLFPSRSSLVKL